MTQTPQTRTKKSKSREARDPFIEQVEIALEHVQDVVWLGSHSPLASIVSPTQGQTRVIAADLVATRGRQLQTKLRETAQRLSNGPPNGQGSPDAYKILELTYFERPTHLNQEGIALALGLPHATYYRHRAEAVRALGRQLIETTQPSIYIESPPWVSREALFPSRLESAAALLRALQQRKTVSVLGTSGIGKSFFAGVLSALWGQQPVFWYTIRPGINDHISQLMMALARFLKDCGQPQLWAQLMSSPERTGINVALGLIQTAFASLEDQVPLICIDEVEWLQAEMGDAPHRLTLRGFVESLCQLTPQIPVLLIGQHLTIATNVIHTLEPLLRHEELAVLSQSHIAISSQEADKLREFTRGIPWLIQLYTLLRRDWSTADSDVQRLPRTDSFQWLIRRIYERLRPDERDLLQLLAVLRAPLPADALLASNDSERSGTLQVLKQLQVIQTDVENNISLHHTVQSAVIASIPAELRPDLHQLAAHICQMCGRFTAAAYHLIQANRTSEAIWVWQAHSEEEFRAGQASSALEHFLPLNLSDYADDADRKALALLRAELQIRVGNSELGHNDLNQVHWSANTVSGFRARKLYADIAYRRGDVVGAIDKLREGLETLRALPQAQTSLLHTRIGRLRVLHGRDFEGAKREALAAQLATENLLGEIEDEQGHTLLAMQHYETALRLASELGWAPEKAIAHQNIGIVKARLEATDDALSHLQRSAEQFEKAGNRICAVGAQSNMAYAHIMARQYRDALGPASEALAFFESIKHSYWISLSAANLAEAHANLGNLSQAEIFAWRVIREEDRGCRPYALYVLGQINIKRKRFQDAREYCQQAVALADANTDRWALGAAWRVCGELHLAQGNTPEMQSALDKARDIFESLGAIKEATRLDSQTRP
jgi:tetratricopeptide (TPR) repeat protein